MEPFFTFSVAANDSATVTITIAYTTKVFNLITGSGGTIGCFFRRGHPFLQVILGLGCNQVGRLLWMFAYASQAERNIGCEEDVINAVESVPLPADLSLVLLKYS